MPADVGKGVFMERLNRRIHLLFTFSLVASILFVFGIPMIVLGAVNRIFAVMILGIVFTAVDFYAIPFLWMAYARYKPYQRLVYAVQNEHLLCTDDLAAQMHMEVPAVRQMLFDCVRHLYLTGYLFDGEQLTPNTRTAPKPKMLVATCESCGAHLEYAEGEVPVCPYCGTPRNG